MGSLIIFQQQHQVLFFPSISPKLINPDLVPGKKFYIDWEHLEQILVIFYLGEI